MRPKSMILLAVAGLCGLVAAFAATKVMEAKDDGPDEIIMEKIYVEAGRRYRWSNDRGNGQARGMAAGQDSRWCRAKPRRDPGPSLVGSAL